MKNILCFVALTLTVLTAGWGADEEIATTFSLVAPNAKLVEVAGEFTNWKTVPLTKDDAGKWSKTINLKPGYYGYKLVVDGDWQFDPGNPARKLVNDLENSGISVGGVQPNVANGPATVTFTYNNTTAKTVHVAGEFNNWLDNVAGKVTGHEQWLMKNDGSGKWSLTTPLKPGKYKFKYVVDGGEKWEKDANLPATDDGNSVVEVKAPAAAEAGKAAAPAPAGMTAVSFNYSDPNAKAVAVAGQFNKWNSTANPMAKDANGIWTVTIQLKPGKYEYKFVVDGNWQMDPTNPDVADDGSGTKNSVKIVQ